jgi:hypothetical protein
MSSDGFVATSSWSPATPTSITELRHGAVRAAAGVPGSRVGSCLSRTGATSRRSACPVARRSLWGRHGRQHGLMVNRYTSDRRLRQRRRLLAGGAGGKRPIAR